jgi:tetratricopeptide (TPR) repeat protein
MNIDLGDVTLPPPADWQKFERFCRDLWAEIWGDPNAQANGRSGQKQAGVDVFGYNSKDGLLCGVQCKRRGATNEIDSGKITEKVLRAEVEKAKTFKPPLSGEFVLASTAKRDVAIQEVARQITKEHAERGLFPVRVYAWDDIVAHLGDHIEVYKKHYASFLATFRALDGAGSGVEGLLPPQEDRRPRAYASGATTTMVFSDGVSFVDVEYRAEIELVGAALKEGQARVALKQADSLRARIWAGANGETRARLCMVVGQAFLAVGNGKDAAASFLDAANYAPDSSDVQAQVALGHALRGDSAAAQTWAARALSRNPGDIVATQVAISFDSRSDDEVLAEYERQVGRRAEVYAVLGHRAAKRGELVKAAQFFETAVDLDGTCAEIVAVCGQVLVELVSEDVCSHVHEGPETRKQLRRAVELLSRALSVPMDDETRRARVGWFVARIAALHMLRSADVATAADEAIRLCGRCAELVRLRAAIASDAGEHHRVIELLEGLPQPREIDDMGAMAAALGNLGEFERAAALWSELLERPDLEEHQRYEAARCSAFSLVRQNRHDDATRQVEQSMDASPGELLPVLVAAATFERVEDVTRRDELVEAAMGVAAGSSVYLRSLLGDALMRAERWGEAAELYGEVVPKGSGGVYAERLLYSLFKAGRLESVLVGCDAMEVTTGSSLFLAELRSATHESLGNVDGAIEVCTAFLRGEPTCAKVKLRLASVLLRRGDAEEAARAVEQVKWEEIDSVQSATRFASALLELGRATEALEVAYKTRRRYLSDVEAHLAYIDVYTRAGGEREVHGCDVVTVESAVQLRGAGAPGWILLCDSDVSDINQKEYPRTHALTKELLGRRVGATLSVGGARGSWEVVAVGSKYGFALARTLETFPARFPARSEIQAQEIPTGEEELVARFTEQFQAIDVVRNQLLAQYHAGHCGVGVVAELLNRSSYEALALLRMSPGGVRCSTNGLEEREASLAALSDETARLVLDATAIATLDGLGMLRDGSLGPRVLMVAQSTLDEVRAEAARWDHAPSEGQLRIGLENGHLVRHMASREEVAAVHRHWLGLWEWLHTNAKSAPVPPGTAERLAQHQQLGREIGQGFWDSVRIATQPGVVLVSDDLWVRQLGRSMLSLNGVCSGLVMMSECEAGRLPRQRYDDAMVTLITWGYRSLSVSASTLEAAARADQWQVGARVPTVLRSLRGPDTSIESATVVGAHFIRSVWLNVASTLQRAAFLTAVLDALVFGRNRAVVLKRFAAVTGQLLALHPVAQDEIVRVTDGWEKADIVGMWR